VFWRIAAFLSLSEVIAFNRIFVILYTGGAISGLLPFTNTLFGLTPLFGNNVWFNALVAAIAFYDGFVKSTEIETASPSTPQPSL
jgi:hypothetical protein